MVCTHSKPDFIILLKNPGSVLWHTFVSNKLWIISKLTLVLSLMSPWSHSKKYC